SLTEPQLGDGTVDTPAREIYNAACAELTMLLRSAEGGSLWNHPLTLPANNATYHLRLQGATPAIWSPDYFTSFVRSDQVKETLIQKQNHHDGVGGSLVGVRALSPSEEFATAKGIAGPVTATLDFKGNDDELAMRRPAKQTKELVEGKLRTLKEAFLAPISYYKLTSNLL